MRDIYQTVRQPVITEKSTILREDSGVYCFRADLRANKIEIARAVEQLFGVKVADVRTSKVKGKTRRVGRRLGKRPDWKKAWVKLAPGEKEIDLFEGAS
jgi:large subunit ribosomal protein L23